MKVTLSEKSDECPGCGATMAEVGAPIWDTYCPNKACDYERRQMLESMARRNEQREREEYERLKKKFG